jgi:uncharacterized membrane protein YhiD involved in acid resistance
MVISTCQYLRAAPAERVSVSELRAAYLPVATALPGSELIWKESSPDPNAVSRVIQAVLTGIGFRCAGVALHQPTSSRITGLTTPPAVWLTAGLGLACGLRQFALGLAGLAVACVIVFVGRPIEVYLQEIYATKHERSRGDQRVDGAGDSDG